MFGNMNHLSHLMTKPTKWHVPPAKTQISLGIRPVWSESSLSAWRKLLEEMACAHNHFVGFVMRWLIWLCSWAVHVGLLYQWRKMRYFKHKRGCSLFSQIKTLKFAEFKCKKKCFYANITASYVTEISPHTLMSQYLQNSSDAIASALCIKAAKKMLNSDLSCSNSGYNGVSIGN